MRKDVIPLVRICLSVLAVVRAGRVVEPEQSDGRARRRWQGEVEAHLDVYAELGAVAFGPDVVDHGPQHAHPVGWLDGHAIAGRQLARVAARGGGVGDAVQPKVTVRLEPVDVEARFVVHLQVEVMNVDGRVADGQTMRVDGAAGESCDAIDTVMENLAKTRRRKVVPSLRGAHKWADACGEAMRRSAGFKLDISAIAVGRQISEIVAMTRDAIVLRRANEIRAGGDVEVGEVPIA